MSPSQIAPHRAGPTDPSHTGGRVPGIPHHDGRRRPDPGRWGVEAGFRDTSGQWRPCPDSTAEAVLAAMDADGPGPDLRGGPWVVPAGRPVAVDSPWALTLEDGSRRHGSGPLPADLPLGYHRLDGPDPSGPVLLVVTPEACHLADGMRIWGWAVQLPALRSARSWGMGDFADLAGLGRWTQGLGAGVVLLNPLHAPAPGLPQEASPYFASSRVFRSPLYLRVEDLPGAADLPATAAAARAGRALNAGRLIDRDEVWRRKSAVLEELWTRAGPDPGFTAYREAGGDLLTDWSTFCALSESFGRSWPSWPPPLHLPTSEAVTSWRQAHPDRVDYHAWLQWQAERQLAAAASTIGLAFDLAIGADPGGADAWMWQDCLATGVRVGAPPDAFNPAGQDWGFPPFDPWKLRRAGFGPFIQVVRAALSHAAGLRVDHVAGLFRLYWIPPGADPAAGAYVRYPWEEMLAILALESVRAGAWVVGEDLGTVEPFVREELARRRILTTRLVWFESAPPPAYPERALAAVTTHDLPTVAGLWTGSDREDQRRAGVEPDEEAEDAIRRRVGDWLGVGPDASPAEAAVAVHRLLARAPAAVRLATLEDALGVPERPNLPGTTAERRPNWSLALPVALEELMTDPGVRAVAAALSGE